MPTLTVDLAETYSLSLRESKVTRVDWKKIDGKNKLRRFFVHPKWEDYIARVSVSSGGAKGGVFFLEAYEVASARLTEAIASRSTSPLLRRRLWRRLHLDGHLQVESFTHGHRRRCPQICS